MNLLNRYLRTIAILLPRAQRESIEAELRGTLLAEIETQQAELCRALSTEELGTLLKTFGHPVIVAARYRSHRQLIGPAIAPFYLFALQVGLGVTLITHIILSGLAMASGQDAIHVLVITVRSLCESGIEIVGGTTLITLFVERFGFADQLVNALTNSLANWRPSRLPRIPTLRARPRASTLLALDFIGIGLLTLLLTHATDSMVMTALPSFGERVVPTTMLFELGRVALFFAVAQAGIHLLEVVQPAYARFCSFANVAFKVITLLLLSAFFIQKPWIEIVGLPATIAQQANSNLNTVIGIGVIAVAVITLFQLTAELMRAMRAGSTPNRSIERLTIAP